jgi:hypothetical protein
MKESIAMAAIIGWISITIMVAVFLGLPVYLLYLIFTSKRVDHLINKEAAGYQNLTKK